MHQRNAIPSTGHPAGAMSGILAGLLIIGALLLGEPR